MPEDHFAVVIFDSSQGNEAAPLNLRARRVAGHFKCCE